MNRFWPKARTWVESEANAIEPWPHNSTLRANRVTSPVRWSSKPAIISGSAIRRIVRPGRWAPGQLMSLATASVGAPIEAGWSNDQQCPVLGPEFRGQRAELGLGVGQGLVERLLPGLAHGADRHFHTTKNLPTCEESAVMPPSSRWSAPFGPVTPPPGHAPLRGHRKDHGGRTNGDRKPLIAAVVPPSRPRTGDGCARPADPTRPPRTLRARRFRPPGAVAARVPELHALDAGPSRLLRSHRVRERSRPSLFHPTEGTKEGHSPCLAAPHVPG